MNSPAAGHATPLRLRIPIWLSPILHSSRRSYRSVIVYPSTRRRITPWRRRYCCGLHGARQGGQGANHYLIKSCPDFAKPRTRPESALGPAPTHALRVTSPTAASGILNCRLPHAGRPSNVAAISIGRRRVLDTYPLLSTRFASLISLW